MVLVIGFFLIHLLRTCVPRVPDSFFIFNEDEDNKLILATKYRPVRHFETVIPQMAEPPCTQKSSSIEFKLKYVPKSVSQTEMSDMGSHKDQHYESSDEEEEIEMITYHKEPELEVIEENIEPTKTEDSGKKQRFDTEVMNISNEHGSVSYEVEEKHPRPAEATERKQKPKLKNKGPTDSLALKKPKFS